MKHEKWITTLEKLKDYKGLLWSELCKQIMKFRGNKFSGATNHGKWQKNKENLNRSILK